MRILKKIKRIIELSKKDKRTLDLLMSLTDKQIEDVPEENEGNGGAVFFDEGTEAEFDEFQKSEAGLKGWYERLKNL